MSRRRAFALTLAVGMPALLLAVWHPWTTPPELAPVFRQPHTYCGVVDQKSFQAKVDAVTGTSPADGLQKDLAAVVAGLLRQAADFDTTPTDRRGELRALADAVEDGARTGDLRRARLLAIDLDRRARVDCR